MKTIMAIIGIKFFGAGALSLDVKLVEMELAQQEFFKANAALRQAQENMDNAEPAYIDVAIEDLNIAFHRADNATRKLRLLAGLVPVGV